MNIVTPYAKMIAVGALSPDRPAGEQVLRAVELYGRVSHRSEERMTEDSWRRFLEAVVLQHGDWSITEHATATVQTEVDRGITHEWVRHRIGAYTQESTRFVRYRDHVNVIPPPMVLAPPAERFAVWRRGVEAAEDSYLELLRLGVPPQEARSVLPTGLAAKLIVTYNLRSWRHFFLMRTSREAHPQMREVAIPLLAEFQEKIPLLYDDIIPEQRQADNMRLPG